MRTFLISLIFQGFNSEPSSTMISYTRPRSFPARPWWSNSCIWWVTCINLHHCSSISATPNTDRDGLSSSSRRFWLRYLSLESFFICSLDTANSCLEIDKSPFKLALPVKDSVLSGWSLVTNSIKSMHEPLRLVIIFLFLYSHCNQSEWNLTEKSNDDKQHDDRARSPNRIPRRCLLPFILSTFRYHVESVHFHHSISLFFPRSKKTNNDPLHACHRHLWYSDAVRLESRSLCFQCSWVPSSTLFYFSL